MAKGKHAAFDPRKPRNLSIYTAANYPAWQARFVEMVREALENASLDSKDFVQKVGKSGEKKAMPFVQGLKKRLAAGESKEAVFERKLAFDEVDVLKEMLPGLRKTTGCKGIEIVVVDEGGKTGTTTEGFKKEGLPPVAEGAVPGGPTFFFENVQA